MLDHSTKFYNDANNLVPPTVRIASGDLFGWGEADQYGPAEPVASAIQVRRRRKYFLSVNIFLFNSRMCWLQGSSGARCSPR